MLKGEKHGGKNSIRWGKGKKPSETLEDRFPTQKDRKSGGPKKKKGKGGSPDQEGLKGRGGGGGSRDFNREDFGRKNSAQKREGRNGSRGFF